MVFLFDYRLRKARKYWCRYRYRSLKRENNSELLRKLDDIEKMIMPLEKQESEIKRRRSKSELIAKVKSQLLEIREELANSKKMSLLATFHIHRIRSVRKRWCKLRLRILKNDASDERDRLLDELDGIEDDLQTVEEGRVSSRFDKGRILGSVEKSLSEIESKIKGKLREEKEEVEEKQEMPEEERREEGKPEEERREEEMSEEERNAEMKKLQEGVDREQRDKEGGETSEEIKSILRKKKRREK